MNTGDPVKRAGSIRTALQDISFASGRANTPSWDYLYKQTQPRNFGGTGNETVLTGM